MTTMILLRGEPAAVVGARRWYLAPTIAKLPTDHPDRRRVTVVCLVLTAVGRSVGVRRTWLLDLA